MIGLRVFGEIFSIEAKLIFLTMHFMQNTTVETN